MEIKIITYQILEAPILHTLELTKVLFLDLTTAIQQANNKFFPHRKPPRACSQPWWDAACTQAAQTLRTAGLDGPNTRQHAHCQLKKTVQEAKCTWAAKAIHNSSIWDVTQWRHGRRLSHIQALRLPDGTLTYDHNPMASALSARFFVPPIPGLSATQPDNPELLPERDFEPFLNIELGEYLRATSSTSAPGPSQISWPILKWLWPVISTHVTALFNGCLAHAFHPPLWKHALVQVIPKPGKADYFVPKSYCPISLLDCLGKLLEKAVAKRITHDIDVAEVLPPNQFGSRARSCCLDAALTLTHHVTLAHKINWRSGALLFDISGFFDNISQERLREILCNRGFNSLIIEWVDAFLMDRTLQL